jgi:hypothetical protein
MTKAKLFHAGYGKWEVRRKSKGRILGIGYFYPKKEAIEIINKINKKK